MDLYPLILESTDLQQAAEINSTRKVKASDVNLHGYIVAITVLCLTEEWFILLWLAILLTITV
jgi:hypothetical protein